MSFQGNWLRAKSDADRRPQDHCVLDEVDSLFIDSVSHMTMLSSDVPSMDYVQPIYGLIWSHMGQRASVLRPHPRVPERSLGVVGPPVEGESDPEKCFMIEGTEMECEEVPDPQEWICAGCVTYVQCMLGFGDDPAKVEIPQHLRSFVESVQLKAWVQNAFLAMFVLRENEHYVCEDNTIIPVDQGGTGCRLQNTTLSDGLQQFLQIKHNFPLSAETFTVNYLSNVTFFRRYGPRLVGLTGTLGNEKTSTCLRDVYTVDTFEVPPFRQRRFIELEAEVMSNEVSHRKMIISSCVQVLERGMAVLLIVPFIKTVDEFACEFQRQLRSDKVRVYRDETQSAVTTDSLEPGTLVVATNVAGRGTDFAVTDDVNRRGGLHVCVSFLPENDRVEAQNLGRTSRSGNPGTGQLILLDAKRRSPQQLRDERDKLVKRNVLDRMREEADRMGWRDELYRLFVNYRRGEVKQVGGSDGCRVHFQTRKERELERQFGVWIKTVKLEGCMSERFKEFTDPPSQQENAGLWTTCGRELLRGGHSAKAEECFKKAIAAEPKFCEFAHMNMARILIERHPDMATKSDEETVRQAVRGHLREAEALLQERIQIAETLHLVQRSETTALADQVKSRVRVYEEALSVVFALIGPASKGNSGGGGGADSGDINEDDGEAAKKVLELNKSVEEMLVKADLFTRSEGAGAELLEAKIQALRTVALVVEEFESKASVLFGGGSQPPEQTKDSRCARSFLLNKTACISQQLMEMHERIDAGEEEEQLKAGLKEAIGILNDWKEKDSPPTEEGLAVVATSAKRHGAWKPGQKVGISFEGAEETKHEEWKRFSHLCTGFQFGSGALVAALTGLGPQFDLTYLWAGLSRSNDGKWKVDGKEGLAAKRKRIEDVIGAMLTDPSPLAASAEQRPPPAQPWSAAGAVLLGELYGERTAVWEIEEAMGKREPAGKGKPVEQSEKQNPILVEAWEKCYKLKVLEWDISKQVLPTLGCCERSVHLLNGCMPGYDVTMIAPPAPINWGAFWGMLCLGILQICVGIALVAATGGVGSQVGMALIGQGIGDLLEIINIVYYRSFSWKVWGITKGATFLVDLVCLGFSQIGNAVKAAGTTAMSAAKCAAQVGMKRAFGWAAVKAAWTAAKTVGVRVVEWGLNELNRATVLKALREAFEKLVAARLRKLLNEERIASVVNTITQLRVVGIFPAVLRNLREQLFAKAAALKETLAMVTSAGKRIYASVMSRKFGAGFRVLNILSSALATALKTANLFGETLDRMITNAFSSVEDIAGKQKPVSRDEKAEAKAEGDKENKPLRLNETLSPVSPTGTGGISPLQIDENITVGTVSRPALEEHDAQVVQAERQQLEKAVVHECTEMLLRHVETDVTGPIISAASSYVVNKVTSVAFISVNKKNPATGQLEREKVSVEQLFDTKIQLNVSKYSQALGQEYADRLEPLLSPEQRERIESMKATAATVAKARLERIKGEGVAVQELSELAGATKENIVVHYVDKNGKETKQTFKGNSALRKGAGSELHVRLEDGHYQACDRTGKVLAADRRGGQPLATDVGPSDCAYVALEAASKAAGRPRAAGQFKDAHEDAIRSLETTKDYGILLAEYNRQFIHRHGGGTAMNWTGGELLNLWHNTGPNEMTVEWGGRRINPTDQTILANTTVDGIIEFDETTGRMPLHTMYHFADYDVPINRAQLIAIADSRGVAVPAGMDDGDAAIRDAAYRELCAAVTTELGPLNGHLSREMTQRFCVPMTSVHGTIRADNNTIIGNPTVASQLADQVTGVMTGPATWPIVEDPSRQRQLRQSGFGADPPSFTDNVELNEQGRPTSATLTPGLQLDATGAVVQAWVMRPDIREIRRGITLSSEAGSIRTRVTTSCTLPREIVGVTTRVPSVGEPLYQAPLSACGLCQGVVLQVASRRCTPRIIPDPGRRIPPGQPLSEGGSAEVSWDAGVASTPSARNQLEPASGRITTRHGH
eukprot:GHVU01033520.1.p1 GENE.GHVU01033520.1~~GHVU01033520.1.p1  ORF type:complete len:2045 (+),score=299.29 GHVU01033520.1:212-6136(+)